VVAAAVLADLAGADGITIHLRGDRRHIQDEDLRVLRSVVKSHLNLEMAPVDEMVRIATATRPNTVTLVPERPDEITTEGGLDVVAHVTALQQVAGRLLSAGLRVSIFVDPVIAQIEASQRAGAQQIEICTAAYAELTEPGQSSTPEAITDELRRINDCAGRAAELGLEVAAGHGLTYRNVRRIAEIPQIEELNIGHNIVARAALAGMERAVREMLDAIGR
jgi:pyridoxine 5-phosphate synthase